MSTGGPGRWRVEPEDVSRERMSLFVRKSKNRRERWVPIADEVILHALMHCANRKLPSSGYYRGLLADECARAEMKIITPHTFRHSRAKAWLDGGVRVLTVRDWMGHASVSETEGYLDANQISNTEVPPSGL